MKKIIMCVGLIGISITLNAQDTIQGVNFRAEHSSYNASGIHDSHIKQWNRLSLALKSENNSLRVEDWSLGANNIKTLLSVNVNGRVGIGTSNPTTKLHIHRSDSQGSYETKFSGNAIEFKRSSNNHSYIDKIDNGSLKIRMGSNYLTRMSILNNGNVGIGTSNPDMKLTVKGNIHAEEVKIDLSVPAPDYVFKSDYDLRTLNEVESFINDQGHLPDVPSATDFKENGVMQAETDMILLRKIEELTLYAINQEKKIKELESQIEVISELESRLKMLLSGLQE